MSRPGLNQRITRNCPFSRTLLLLLLLLTLVGGAASCRRSTGSSPEEKGSRKGKPAASRSSASAAIPVTTAPVQVRSVRRTLDFVGTFYANNEVTVSSEIEGQVIRVAFDLGDRVAAGSLLAWLDARESDLKLRRALSELQRDLAQLGLSLDGSGHRPGPVGGAAPERGEGPLRASETLPGNHPEDALNIERVSTVLRARATLDDAASNLQRVKSLYESRVVSQQEYDAVLTRFTLAQANLQAAQEEVRSLIASVKAKREVVALAQKELSDTEIRSPLEGYVFQRHLSSGEHVKVGAPLFTLVDADPIKLRGEVPERFAAELKIGQWVEATVESFAGEVFSGELRRISPASNRESRSVLIEALLSNRDGRLKPGFFAKGAIVARTADQALMVPADSLVAFAGVTKLFVIGGGRAQERLVQLGVRQGEEVEILRGVKAGEQVAISGLTRLSQGRQVSVSGR
ncbi:MAG: efflux RND transporter periplasmic adaptor subunit [Candidatus Tectomicrobia bacterium]|uniref:Efflux RND transporter periplasmic adaptor subunit n=1 Tax=Tectimicrobiota bacterium TaxID=2528274 RepID=A0A932CNM6_UNCTE|nr:efflux RND transporter periplasmic adaptor subunit [Candidatus Tectomicrobia bacterium]